LQKASNLQGAYNLIANRLQLHFGRNFPAWDWVAANLRGDTAAALLKKSERSLLFVAS
jgi:hypothetical protein